MRIDNSFDDRKAQTHPLNTPAVKGLEDELLAFGIDAGATVFNLDLDEFSLGLL